MFTDIVKKHKKLLHFAANIYNIVHWNNYWLFHTKCKFLLTGAFLNRCRFQIDGTNNHVTVGAKARLKNCRITIIGNNNHLFIGGGHTIIRNTHFWLQGDGCKIIIGEDFTMESGHIASTEGESITIGNDCMFSNDVEIRNGDSHAIFNNQHKRINKATPVIIGNHIWLGAHARIMKGSNIPDGCIIGNSCVVSKPLDRQNAIYAGIPAKVINENITWDRFIPKCSE